MPREAVTASKIGGGVDSKEEREDGGRDEGGGLACNAVLAC